jgi:hypothetical protein
MLVLDTYSFVPVESRNRSVVAMSGRKTLRYRVLHAVARLVHGGRRRRWKFPASWPWAEAITRAWQRICALPDTS